MRHDPRLPSGDRPRCPVRSRGRRGRQAPRLRSGAWIILPILMGSPGCGDTDGRATPRGEARTNPFLGDGRVTELQITEELELDLTGDGTPERVELTVGGEDPRDLEMELTVFGREGAVLHTAAWSSAEYAEFRRAGAEEIPVWVASQSVRDRLEDLLGDDAVRPLVEDEIDQGRVRRELQLEEWRQERGFPASAPLTAEEEAEVGRIQVPEERVRELVGSLAGSPAFSYLAGESFRTIAWSPELGRFVTVVECC
jgi:hypothetical protein